MAPAPAVQLTVKPLPDIFVKPVIVAAAGPVVTGNPAEGDEAVPFAVAVTTIV